jgi:broad-specificity NMP kinase
MKTLYLIGGPMGVGKTTVCQVLKKRLTGSVFLDGDWCWDMHPFQVTDETRAMVTDNIRHLLNNFIKCSAISHVLFAWVMHEQHIIDSLVSGLDLSDCTLKTASLICSPEVLTARLRSDVEAGIRSADIIDRSVARLPLYRTLQSVKLDVSELTAEQAAERILAL